MKSIEDNLSELMQEYKNIIMDRNAQSEQIEQDIFKLQLRLSEIVKPYNDRLVDIEAKIRIPMLEYKHTFVSPFGKINYRKGAVRRVWNLDALDQICEAKPTIKNEIWAFREEKTGEPTINIKLNEGD